MDGYIKKPGLYRIICRNPEKTFAYCEKIAAYKPVSAKDRERLYLLGKRPCFYISHAGSVYTCEQTDIITDPEIINTLTDTVIKIKL